MWPGCCGRSRGRPRSGYRPIRRPSEGRPNGERQRHEKDQAQMRSVVTRLATRVSLALVAGAAAGAMLTWPEQRIVAGATFVLFLAVTIIFAMRLARALVQSIEQVSQTLSRLAKGEFDAPVPEFGSIAELR